MKFITDITRLIGNTPLIRLIKMEKKLSLNSNLLAKLEYFNPAGSIKDRTALYMINEAEKSGQLTPGATIIEPTSGNTGIGLACVGASRGYKVILTMPDTMSKERIGLLKAYGAQVELTEGAKGMSGAIEKAQQLQQQTPGSMIAGQFENPANALAHYETTARELWEQCGHKLDALICGVGTGGTFTGCARYLKEQNPNLTAIAVEPTDSPLISKGVSGPHGLMGIGANFIPKVLDTSLIDKVITVSTKDAYDTAKLTAATEGFLIGITSAAAIWAAAKYMHESGKDGENVAVILPDSGERYLSTGLFE